MKKLVFTMITLFGVFLFGCSSSEGFRKELTEGDIKVIITSDQPPHVGINKWKLKIYENGKPITDADVKINGYMPPMPGMPEMSMDYKVVNKGDHYESDVNLSMGGTWQITIYIEKEGETKKVKFGFNL